MRKQKFLIIGQLPPPVHGTNVMADIFIKSLRKLGHEVILVSKTFSHTMAELEKVNCKKLLMVVLITIRLFRAVIENNFDLCFFFITMKLRAFMVDALFLLILRFFGIPYVLYCHGQGLRELGTTGPFWRQWLVRQTLTGAAGALVLGQRLKKDVSFCIKEERIFVLQNALPDRGRNRHGLQSLNPHECRILFFSNLRKTKGPWEFLLMAKEVAAKEPHAHFILAGSPVERQFYQNMLHFREKEQLTQRIDILEGIYGEAKAELFRGCSIFVYPTQRDALPLVLLEAMQWGLPVITSGEGAIPEVVIDGVTGYIVNPKDIGQLTDRALRLVRDPALRRRMGEAGRRRYEDYYSIEAYKRNLQKALQFFGDIIPFKNWSSSP